MNRIKIWIDTRDSFWFVPLLYSISAIILVLLVNITDTWILSYVDQQLLQPITTEKAVAVWLYGSLVTAILTMTTISFSTIMVDRKSTRLNSSHVSISYAVFCLKKKILIIIP